uniref:Metalloprotease n=1 Tax=Melittobia digitata TaxID=29043 RepID=Q5Y973_9HYME|nr:metalloprotease [Melittobia digitata]
MAAKGVLFVICVFGAFLQIQSAAITKNEDTEFKEDIRYVQVEVDNIEYNLTLVHRPNEIFFEETPVWTASSIEGENDYKISEVPHEKRQINGLFYEDDEYMATFLATYDETVHEIYYNGLINIGTKIYKVESAVDDWWRNPDVPETSSNEVQSSETDEKQSKETAETRKLRSSYVSNNNNAKLLEKPLTTLHPKILAVVDYNLYSELGESLEQVIEYVATFWDAVNLKYSKLNSPNIKITVTGVLIVKDKDVSLTHVDLKSFNENFVKKTEFVNYDATFIMSQSSAKTIKGAIVQLGSICNRQNSIAFVQDNGSYEGLLSATHELGHLLNLPHDGLDGAGKCTVDSDSDVTFMSTGVESTKQLTWSQCSRDIIQEFAKSTAAACLENRRRYE